MAAFFWIPKEEKKYSVEQIEEVSKTGGRDKEGVDTFPPRGAIPHSNRFMKRYIER